MTPLADVAVEQHGDSSVARIRGEIDASNVRWLGSRLRSGLTNHSHGLAVVLTDATYLDSAGIALLFELAAELEQRRQRLVLVIDGGSPVARMVSLTGLDHAVGSYRTLDDAVAAMGSHLA